jgi:hypothetical protein
MSKIFNPRIKIEVINMNNLKIKKDNKEIINLDKVIQDKMEGVRKI